MRIAPEGTPFIVIGLALLVGLAAVAWVMGGAWWIAAAAWTPIAICTGTPLEGWTVVAQPEGQNDVRLRSFPTDAAGGFAVNDVDDAPHKLWVQEPKGWQRFPRLVLRDVWPRSEVTLQLEDPVLTTGTVVGEVVSASGDASAAARLSFWHEDLRLWREYAVDSKTGAIRVEGVPPGTCWLELRSRMHPWKRLGSFEVEAGEAVDLGRQVLPLGGVLAGEIASCPEDALETLRFFLIDGEGREGGVMQRTGTSFRSSPLARGEYVLEVRGDYVAGARERFVVASGEQTALTLRLEHAPLRRVVIECAAGAEPLRHVWCEVHEGAGARVWMNGNLRRLEDGRFVARVSLPPGSYRLVTGTGDGRTLEAALVLTDAEGQEPLRLTL